MKPKKKPTDDKRRKLEVRKERIRQLDGEQLEHVNGGMIPTAGCTTTDRI